MDQYEINKEKLEENMFDEIEFEETEQKEAFKVDSDSSAEWSLQKIKGHQEEHKRIKRLCESMINEYKERLIENDKELERETGYFKSQLKNYFDSIPETSKKVTKTLETYKLGLGKLVLKKQAPEIKTDKELLLNWVEKNASSEFVKETKSVEWGALKKTLKQVDNNYVTEDGEIVEGVILIEKDDRFEVVI